MEELSKDISMGLKLLNGIFIQDDVKYDSVFLFTNELLSDYYKNFPIKDGNILTIASGGDHILQAVCEGAKEIDAFDINRFAIYISKLKIAAVKALDYDEFCNYFRIDRNRDFGYFDINIYNKIRPYLNDRDRLFWDTMYKSGDFQTRSEYFIISNSYIDNGDNSYTKEDNFYMTKEKLNRVSINYYCEGFPNIFKKISDSKKYDAIFLSNIYDWFNMREANVFPIIIDNIIFKYLSDKGIASLYAPVCANNGIELYNGHISRNCKVIVYQRQLKKKKGDYNE